MILRISPHLVANRFGVIEMDTVEFYRGRDLELILEAIETYTDNLGESDAEYNLRCAYEGIVYKIESFLSQ